MLLSVLTDRRGETDSESLKLATFVCRTDAQSVRVVNCRVRLSRPIYEFIDAWCQQGPAHHVTLGIGDVARQIESFAEAMKFKMLRV